MRRLFWLIFLFGAYLWVLTSGHDAFFLAKGKALYQLVDDWISTAEADFHLKKDAQRKKSKRWD